jgi:hypothetical protein
LRVNYFISNSPHEQLAPLGDLKKICPRALLKVMGGGGVKKWGILILKISLTTKEKWGCGFTYICMYKINNG